MYQEEHALFIFSVLEETVISEENKRVKKNMFKLETYFFIFFLIIKIIFISHSHRHNAFLFF